MKANAQERECEFMRRLQESSQNCPTESVQDVWGYNGSKWRIMQVSGN